MKRIYLNTADSVPAMSRKETVTYRLLLLLGMLLVSIFAVWWFRPAHVPTNFRGFFHLADYLLFAAVSYVVWYQIINECFMWFVAGKSRVPVPKLPVAGRKTAFLTAFVPGYEPIGMLRKTLKAMVAADQPHDTWLLDEGNDSRVRALCEKLGVYHFSRRDVDKYNTDRGRFRKKTKGGNYNAWFDSFGRNYDYVAQLDVDFVPARDYLTKTLGYFADPLVAFVGTPQVYGNTSVSWIARGASEQAYHFYGSMQKGFYGMEMTLLIGANHVIRTVAHDSIDGYSGHIVEDHLTGMKYYTRKWRSVYVPQILAVGEGPATWGAYFSQQMRWAYGLFDILFRHTPGIARSLMPVHLTNYLLLQQYYFFGLAQVVGIGLLVLYFIAGLVVTPVKLPFVIVGYGSIILFQQLMFLWLARFNAEPATESGIMWRGKFLNWAAWPVYALALFKALFQLPHTYVVTPKGSSEKEKRTDPGLFLPHFVLGTVTAVCLAAAVIFDRRSPLLLFWAVVNTSVMYGFILGQLAEISVRQLPGLGNRLRNLLTMRVGTPKLAS